MLSQAKVEAQEEAVEALREERDEVVREAVRAGMSYRRIASVCGLSMQRIAQIATK